MVIKYDDYIDDDNVIININNYTIEVKQGGYVGENGISVQALYSYLKEKWKTHDTLIKYSFPLTAIDNVTFIANDGKWFIKPNNIKEGMIFSDENNYQLYISGQYEEWKRDFGKYIRKQKLKQIDNEKE